jgi:2-polyprenyl-3-methyl-5-hydroxy-6-metoxy-1,4-benzoquinol methylase
MLALLKRKFRHHIYPLKDLLELVPLNCKLLDVGCGQGSFLKAVAVNRSPLQLGGIEISESLIRSARKELAFLQRSTVHLKTYDGATLPSEISEYTIISLIDVLHHIPKSRQQPFLLALFKTMKRGAHFLLKDIDAGRPLLCQANRLHDFVLGAGGGQEQSKEAVDQLLKATGFRVVSSGERRILWYPHYWFLAVKPE